MDAFKERVFEDAHKLIDELLPKKVDKLDQVFIKTRDRRDKGEHVQDEAALRGVGPGDAIPPNPVVKEAIDVLKREVTEMLHELNTIRLWVRLSMPRIEDGNNFGVEVQEEVLSMLNSLYNSGLSFLRNLSGYNFKRGKLLSTMRKRPHVHEYAAAVRDLDEKQYVNLVQSCTDLRNNYAFLYDKIVKNKAKLNKPRSSTGTVGMY